MTTNAVNWQNAKLNRETDKLIADLDRKVDFEKLGISKDELKEKIRHNQVDEYLQGKKVNAEDRNGFMSGLGSIFRGLGMGGLLGLIGAAVNDESYHNKLTVAYEQATNLPFSEKAGNNHNWDAGGINISDKASIDYTGHTPNSGIVHIKYCPTISVNDQEIQSSELQNNVRLLWTRVRAANSGAVNMYDQSDLMQFTLASSSVFEILRAIVRPLNYINAPRKHMNVFSAWDENVLSVLCGGTTQARTVINQKTEFIQAINSAIRATNSQILPIGFDLTRRRSLLNGRIFTHNGNRDELYIFSPTCYYVYDEANATLVSKQFNLAQVFTSPNNVKLILSEMLQPLVNGTATSVMAGDMYKAYPKQVQAIRELPYTLKGDVYSEDEHILEALRNANIMSSLAGYGTQFDIKQGVNTSLDTFIYQGNLITDPDRGKLAVLYGSASTSYSDAYDGFDANTSVNKDYVNILDVKSDSPERYDIMAGTRFKTSFTVRIVANSDDSSITTATTVHQWGTEIITEVNVNYFKSEYDFSQNTLSNRGIIGQDMYLLMTYFEYFTTEVNFYQRYHYLPIKLKELIWDDNAKAFNVLDQTHGRYNCIVITDNQLMNLNNASFGSLVSIIDSKDSTLE